MKKNHILVTFLVFILIAFANQGCDLFEKVTEHEVIIEENVYLRGATSASGYVNLMEYAIWRDNKDRIKEVTEVIVQIKVTRNGTPTDITVNFYYGEYSATILVGTVTFQKGETHSSLVTMPLLDTQYQMYDLVLRKGAFWYSIQGNTDAADVDFEPVRITVRGTFEII